MVETARFITSEELYGREERHPIIYQLQHSHVGVVRTPEGLVPLLVSFEADNKTCGGRTTIRSNRSMRTCRLLIWEKTNGHLEPLNPLDKDFQQEGDKDRREISDSEWNSPDDGRETIQFSGVVAQ
jgi:hypothetical protein